MRNTMLGIDDIASGITARRLADRGRRELW
jgi:hypothetical protein